jgi:hypothetical protein
MGDARVAVRRTGREILQNVRAWKRILAATKSRIGRKPLSFQEKSAINACRVAALTGATEWL